MVGFTSRPRNKMDPVVLSWMKKINGRLAENSMTLGGMMANNGKIPTTTAVTAAASVPSSLTSTTARWSTSDTNIFFFPSIPDRSALPSTNRSLIPISASSSAKLSYSSSLNLGNFNFTSTLFIWKVSFAREMYSVVNFFSTSDRLAFWNGNRINILRLSPAYGNSIAWHLISWCSP